MGLLDRLFHRNSKLSSTELAEPVSESPALEEASEPEAQAMTSIKRPYPDPEWCDLICDAADKVLSHKAVRMGIMDVNGKWKEYSISSMPDLEKTLHQLPASYLKAVEYIPASNAPAIVYRNPAVCETLPSISDRLVISAKAEAAHIMDRHKLVSLIYSKGKELNILPLLGAVRIHDSSDEPGRLPVPESIEAEYRFMGAGNGTAQDINIDIGRLIRESRVAGPDSAEQFETQFLTELYKGFRDIGLADPYHRRDDLTDRTDSELEAKAHNDVLSPGYRNSSPFNSNRLQSVIGGDSDISERTSREEHSHLENRRTDDYNYER